MTLPVLLAVTTWGLLAAPAAQGDNKADLKVLAGTWDVVSFVIDGDKQALDNIKDIQLTFRPDGTWQVTKAGKLIDKGTFTIDGSAMPKKLTSRSSRPGAGDEPAIFEVQEDVLLFCYSSIADKRPTRFRSEKGSKFGMIVAIRATP
jgi:uncharacterized protein (TIGR03067 family)